MQIEEFYTVFPQLHATVPNIRMSSVTPDILMFAFFISFSKFYTQLFIFISLFQSEDTNGLFSQFFLNIFSSFHSLMKES